MDTKEIPYVLQIGNRVVTRECFLSVRYYPGDRFPASTFFWLCKNKKLAPGQIDEGPVYATLILPPSALGKEKEYEEQVYNKLTSVDGKWKDAGEEAAKSARLNYFFEPEVAPETPSVEESVPETEAMRI